MKLTYLICCLWPEKPLGARWSACAVYSGCLIVQIIVARVPGLDGAVTVRLVGIDRRTIIDTFPTLLTNEKAYSAMANAVNPYGDGKVSERILKACQRIVSQYSGNFYGKQTTE